MLNNTFVQLVAVFLMLVLAIVEFLHLVSLFTVCIFITLSVISLQFIALVVFKSNSL
jgi:hypothetical protein